MAFDNNVETDQNIAKVNRVKKIYLNNGTIYIIDANDDLWAWGTNSYNKLGQGNSYLVTELTKILEGRTEGLDGVKAKNVWAGPTNTFVLDTENRLWACGANAHGVLGQGNNNIYNNFVQVKIEGLDLNTVEIEDIALTYSNQQYSSVLIKCSDGRVYGCGRNNFGGFGIGTSRNYNEFIELSQYNEIWKNAKKIVNQGIASYVLLENGELYGAGINSSGQLGVGHKNTVNVLTKITDSVKNVVAGDNNFLILKENGYLYINDSNGNINQISGIQDVDMKFASVNMIISNSQCYTINTTNRTVSKAFSSYEVDEEVLFIPGMQGFISDSKVYLNGYPNITKPKSKSIYELRDLFSGAQFVQSGGNKINIVDNDGNVYEGLNNKNTEVSNIKQLVSSSGASFALSEDGRLYAKGRAYIWEYGTNKNNYTIITKDGNEEFNNIEKVFAIKNGVGVIFITKDNEIYWAGATSYVAIPGIKGSVQTTGEGNITEYPEKIENNVINSIVDKIKDNKFTFINAAGISGKNMLILTTDGKLYTYSSNSNMSGVGATSDFTEIKFNGTTVEQIETLGGLSLAVLSNGEVYGWGYNTYGILGDGYELGAVYPTPQKLALSNVRTMSLGNGFAVFGTYAGEVYGIGKNDYGQLGTGDNVGASTFVRCKELEK